MPRLLLLIALLTLVLLPAVCGQTRVRVVVPKTMTERVPDQTVASVRQLAEQGVHRLAKDFPGTPSGAILVVLHPDPESMPQALRNHLLFRSPGFALLARDEIHIVLDNVRFNPPNDLRSVVDHELVHILLDQFAGKAGAYIPRWFHEGLAQALAETPYLGSSEEKIVFSLKSRTHLRFGDLEKGFPRDSEANLRLAYGESFSFVSYLKRKLGLKVLLDVARRCGPERSFNAAFAETTGESLVKFEDQWTNYVVTGSGAIERFLLEHCFLIMLAAALPLLALALARRLRRDQGYGDKLARDEQIEDAYLDEPRD